MPVKTILPVNHFTGKKIYNPTYGQKKLRSNDVKNQILEKVSYYFCLFR